MTFLIDWTVPCPGIVDLAAAAMTFSDPPRMTEVMVFGAGYAHALGCVRDGPNASFVGALCNCLCNSVHIAAIPAMRPLPKPTTGRIAVYAINRCGDVAMNVFRV